MTEPARDVTESPLAYRDGDREVFGQMPLVYDDLGAWGVDGHPWVLVRPGPLRADPRNPEL